MILPIRINLAHTLVICPSSSQLRETTATVCDFKLLNNFPFCLAFKITENKQIRKAKPKRKKKNYLAAHTLYHMYSLEACSIHDANPTHYNRRIHVIHITMFHSKINATHFNIMQWDCSIFEPDGDGFTIRSPTQRRYALSYTKCEQKIKKLSSQIHNQTIQGQKNTKSERYLGRLSRASANWSGAVKSWSLQLPWRVNPSRDSTPRS